MEQKWDIISQMDQIELIELNQQHTNQLLLYVLVVIIFTTCMLSKYFQSSVSLNQQKHLKTVS